MRDLIVTPELLVDLRRYNRGIARSRRAYHGQQTYPTPEQQQTALTKAVRKAEAQRRYRAKKKGTP